VGCHGLVAQPLGGAVALAPGAAVAFDQRREWALPARPEHPRKQRLVPVAEIFEVFHVEIARLGLRLGVEDCSRHGITGFRDRY